MKCMIRVRRVGDLPELAKVLVRVHAQDGYPVEGVDDPDGWLRSNNALRSWVAVLGGHAVGQVTLAKADTNDDAARVWVERTGGALTDVATIVRLFVDPSFRSAGAGSRLLSAALKFSATVGRTAVLDVMKKDSAAIKLYERLGGQRIGTFDHHFGDNLTEPAIAFAFKKD